MTLLLMLAAQLVIPHSFQYASLGCQSLTQGQAVTFAWTAVPSPQNITVPATFPQDEDQVWELKGYSVIVDRPGTDVNVILDPGLRTSVNYKAPTTGDYCTVVNAVGSYLYTPTPRIESPPQPLGSEVLPEGWHVWTWPKSKNTIDGYRLYVSSDPDYIDGKNELWNLPERVILANEVRASDEPFNRGFVARPNVTWHVALTEVVLKELDKPPTVSGVRIKQP